MKRDRTKPVTSETPVRRPNHRAQPVVRRSTREGERLEPDVRHDMESRFGRDFGHVRVHTDADAGASALSLGASAYTVGRDIVFSPGAYQPGSGNGRQLLAHELAHVGPEATPAAASRVGSADSTGEREASATADAALAGRATQPETGAATEPGVLHRSLLGAGIGGLIGGVGLGVIGGLLLGPIGAVVGGIVGLVGGAIIGDLASRRERSLSSDERHYAWEIYHDAIDYDAIRITRGSALSTGAARTIGNTINLQPEHFVGDTMDLSEHGKLVLIHEMGHVWQYQNGGLAYIPSSLIPQIVAAARGQSRNVAYDWRNAVRNHIDWADWNAEQQAECISDYNEALQRINAGTATPVDFQTVTLAEPYIALVRRRIGAPGSPRRRPDAAAAGTGSPSANGSPS